MYSRASPYALTARGRLRMGSSATTRSSARCMHSCSTSRPANLSETAAERSRRIPSPSLRKDRSLSTPPLFDRNAIRVGALAASLVLLLIFAGSRQLRDFDWALTAYGVGTMFAAFAIAYRYSVWAQRPPTMVYL